MSLFTFSIYLSSILPASNPPFSQIPLASAPKILPTADTLPLTLFWQSHLSTISHFRHHRQIWSTTIWSTNLLDRQGNIDPEAFSDPPNRLILDRANQLIRLLAGMTSAELDQSWPGLFWVPRFLSNIYFFRTKFWGFPFWQCQAHPPSFGSDVPVRSVF